MSSVARLERATSPPPIDRRQLCEICAFGARASYTATRAGEAADPSPQVRFRFGLVREVHNDRWKRLQSAWGDNGPDCSEPLRIGSCVWQCRYLVAFMS